MTISGPGDKRGGGFVPTGLHPVAVKGMHAQIMRHLHARNYQGLETILRSYFANKKAHNLARNLDEIKPPADFPFSQFVDIVRKAAGGNFHILFVELSPEVRGSFVENLKERDPVAVVILLYQMISLAGKKPEGSKYMEAASQLIFADTVYFMLNNYTLGPDQLKILPRIYQLKYNGQSDIGEIISRSLSEFQTCGNNSAASADKELAAFKVFWKIMEAFRDLSIASTITR